MVGVRAEVLHGFGAPLLDLPLKFLQLGDCEGSPAGLGGSRGLHYDHPLGHIEVSLMLLPSLGLHEDVGDRAPVLTLHGHVAPPHDVGGLGLLSVLAITLHTGGG